MQLTFIVSNKNCGGRSLCWTHLHVWRTLEHKESHGKDTQYPQSRPGWAPAGGVTLKWLNRSRAPDKSYPVSGGLQVIRRCSQLSQGRNPRSGCIQQTAREVPGSIRISSSLLNTLHSQSRFQRSFLSELYRILSFSVFLEDPKQKYLQINADKCHCPWDVI